MFMSRVFVRRDVRPLRRRRPLVEGLEGRQLLSTFTVTKVAPPPAQYDVVGNHIGTNVAMIQGNHIGTNVAMIQGNHIGTNVAMIQGNHIGTNVAMIQGNHIGTNVAMIQGNHIGTNVVVTKPTIIVLE
jgi:UDP-3-O-[3-hydroxymyristoyl] glucosamine N-acyltransferase